MVRKWCAELKFSKCRSKVKVMCAQNLWYLQKGHVIRIDAMPNMKALCLMVRKLCAELKINKCRSKVKVNITCSKFMVPSKRSCHKQHTCQYSLCQLHRSIIHNRCKLTWTCERFPICDDKITENDQCVSSGRKSAGDIKILSWPVWLKSCQG